MANFKVHARVLDLLGEEQIADCPTAISELFKNAFDAYASKVKLDVYPSEDHATLWDDGNGMSEEDVLDRWLVVGTPGKKRANNNHTPQSFPIRPVMGEKGIGRLAISTLGDTLFLLTKSLKSESPTYTALLINWNIVRNDQLLLSDIYVPVKSFSSLDDLDPAALGHMVESFLAPINSDENKHLWKGYEGWRTRINEQLSSFTLDISRLRATGIERAKSGTIFCISSLTQDLPIYVRAPNRDDSDRETPQALLVQLLSAFRSRAVKPEFGVSAPPEIVFEADVRVHDPISKKFRSVFEDWDTFNENDLTSADHHIAVTFEADGSCRGTLRRYDEIIPISFSANDPRQKRSAGSFSLEFWYWQGDPKETRITKEQKAHIDRKLSLFGGVLLYRDSLRVLPYGRPEFDWLKIEERRSLKAGRHFFSYRRMFGSVSISGEENPDLRDKAGREGLKLNKSYREFRQTLIDFLGQIARDHFGDSEDFKAKKAEVEATQLILINEQNRVDAKRKKLAKDLDERLKYIVEGHEKAKLLYTQALTELQKKSAQNDAQAIVELNVDFERKITKLEEQARYVIPTGLSLGKGTTLRRLRLDYEAEWPKFRSVCLQLRDDFSTALKLNMPDIVQATLRKKTFESTLFQARSRIGKAHAEIRSNFEKVVGEFDLWLDSIKHESLSKVESALMKATLANSIDEALNSQFGEVGRVRTEVETVSDEAEAIARDLGRRLIDYFDGFRENDADIVAAVQNDELEELREEVVQNLELVQLGLSVEIIDHDLQKAYRGIKAHLSSLQRLWKDAPKSLNYLAELTANFQHLEQRYQLMSPLYRNSYRKKVEITGRKIFDYLTTFLSHELEIHGVSLTATPEFLSLSFMESPARIFPAFINVVDNAIYWTRGSTDQSVQLGLVDNIITVNDSGVGIHESMLERIFKPFVSQKPSGRGLGLHIAKANLAVAGHDIFATLDAKYKTMSGACICVKLNEQAFCQG